MWNVLLFVQYLFNPQATIISYVYEIIVFVCLVLQSAAGLNQWCSASSVAAPAGGGGAGGGGIVTFSEEQA